MVVNLVSVIFKSKMRKSLKISTKFTAKALCTFLFSPQKSLKRLQFINKIKARNVIYHNYYITTRCTYLAWNSRFSWDIFGSLKILLLRQFRVEEFSTNTKKILKEHFHKKIWSVNSRNGTFCSFKRLYLAGKLSIVKSALYMTH